MLKNILESINDVLGIVAVTSGTALAVIGMVMLGAHAVVLIATCSLVLNIGLTIALRLSNTTGAIKSR